MYISPLSSSGTSPHFLFQLPKLDFFTRKALGIFYYLEISDVFGNKTTKTGNFTCNQLGQIFSCDTIYVYPDIRTVH